MIHIIFKQISITIMTSYSHLSTIQTIFMTLIAVVSNLAGIPVVIKLFRRRSTYFQAFVLMMSVVTSFMYHLCEIYDCTIFLSELQWHRLDNIFAITAFQLIILHAFGSITDQDITLRWSTLLSSIIIQEKDPWNVAFTLIPCVAYVFIALAIRLAYRK